jgi:hypothetical protein
MSALPANLRRRSIQKLNGNALKFCSICGGFAHAWIIRSVFRLAEVGVASRPPSHPSTPPFLYSEWFPFSQTTLVLFSPHFTLVQPKVPFFCCAVLLVRTKDEGPSYSAEIASRASRSPRAIRPREGDCRTNCSFPHEPCST